MRARGARRRLRTPSWNIDVPSWDFMCVSKAVDTTQDDDECIAELRAIWERVKVSLPDEAVTYGVAHSLGEQLRKKGKLEEAKVIHLAALEGKRRVLGEEHKDTLGSLNNTGPHEGLRRGARLLPTSTLGGREGVGEDTS